MLLIITISLEKSSVFVVLVFGFDCSPYHAMLLTEDERVLLDSLPLDVSPALVKLIRVSSPVKNLQSLASEADIDLRQASDQLPRLQF